MTQTPVECVGGCPRVICECFPNTNDKESYRDYIAALTERNADLERIAKYVGVCMSCIHGSYDPNGCTDCLGTGWERGVDPIKRNAALEKELAEAKQLLVERDEALDQLIVQRAELQSALATITAESDKAVKAPTDDETLVAISVFDAFGPATFYFRFKAALENFVRARATLDEIREAGKDNG